MGGVGGMHFGIQTLIPEQANTLCVPLALLSRSRGVREQARESPRCFSPPWVQFPVPLLIAPVVERGKKELVFATIFFFFFLSGSLTD